MLAYESVLESGLQNLSLLEEKDLRSRANDKRSSLATSVATAYRWVFYPEASGLAPASLAVPATVGERIAQRAADRLSSQDYGDPKVLPAMGAIYFNATVALQLWKDETETLDLAEALRRFPQWTYLPILPDREQTLRSCIREGVSSRLWAVAIGDATENRYQRLVESVTELDELVSLFDGSASLVKGELFQLIREELHPEPEEASAGEDDPTTGSEEPQPEQDDPQPGPPKKP